MKKIAVFTSGGDSPGMNACVRAAVRAGIYNGCEVFGIESGYEGMIAGKIFAMNSRSVANIIQNGGTVLKTSRSEAFKTAEGRARAFSNLEKLGIEGLVCIGGDGSYTGALQLHRETGIAVAGAPGTIDNDIYGTDHTIGFDTAINTATEAIDKLRDTADSHGRTFFVEVMGRHSGDIALAVGIGAGAEAVLLPGVENEFDRLKRYFTDKKSMKSFSIVVVAEGDEEGGAMQLCERLKKEVPGFDARVSILGHIQRGGRPTSFDRVLATRLGVACIDALVSGEKAVAVGVSGAAIVKTPLEVAIRTKKQTDPELLRIIDTMSI